MLAAAHEDMCNCDAGRQLVAGWGVVLQSYRDKG